MVKNKIKNIKCLQKSAHKVIIGWESIANKNEFYSNKNVWGKLTPRQ